MATKNAEEWLADCLDSILLQEETNWELLVAEDHSTDKTWEVLESYCKKDQRIISVRSKGQGLLPALYTAYDLATGMLITRMDSDDLMPANKLALLKAKIESVGKGHLALGTVKHFPEEFVMDGFRRYENWLNDTVVSGRTYQEIYKECTIPSLCWMCYKKDFDALGAFGPERYPEDYQLAFRFYKHGMKISPCPDAVHLWRDHYSRISRTYPEYQDQLYLDLKLENFFELDRNQSKKLVLWGAGKKGKKLARKLNELHHDFIWVSNNLKKVGHNIYGTIIQDPGLLDRVQEIQILIMISNDDERAELKQLLKYKNHSDFVFFCG